MLRLVFSLQCVRALPPLLECPKLALTCKKFALFFKLALGDHLHHFCQLQYYNSFLLSCRLVGHWTSSCVCACLYVAFFVLDTYVVNPLNKIVVMPMIYPLSDNRYKPISIVSISVLINHVAAFWLKCYQPIEGPNFNHCSCSLDDVSA
jgi:hypothetical protein